ncbi:MAG: hypothetical protein HYS13_03605 [Planctomycetia bacterium]|nr:hypothetical protein [Planctomycetia bacterium]
MVHLTPEQSEQLKQERPPRVLVENTEYVLVRADVYDKVKAVLGREPEEIDPSFFEFTDIELFERPQ